MQTCKIRTIRSFWQKDTAVTCRIDVVYAWMQSMQTLTPEARFKSGQLLNLPPFECESLFASRWCWEVSHAFTCIHMPQRHNGWRGFRGPSLCWSLIGNCQRYARKASLWRPQDLIPNFPKSLFFTSQVSTKKEFRSFIVIIILL